MLGETGIIDFSELFESLFHCGRDDGQTRRSLLLSLIVRATRQPQLVGGWPGPGTARDCA